MYGSDKIIQLVARSQIGDPGFTASQPVAFQPGTDRDPAVRVGLGSIDPVEILGQLPLEHPPIIKRFGNRRSMIGDPVFIQAGGDRSIHIRFRFAFRMAAERRMGVIIRRHRSL